MSSIPTRKFTTKSDTAFTIRTAMPDDAAAILSYIRAVAAKSRFFVLELDELPPTEEIEREWLQDHLGAPAKIALLAEASGEIIGNLSFENGLHRRIAHQGLLGVSVAKQWRGKGVGTALLQTLLDWARENPILEKVGLTVSSDNDIAIRLYQKIGFVEAGRKPRQLKFGPGDYADAILMHQFVK